MTWLVTSDLHLTERPEHLYRRNFLPWLALQAGEHLGKDVDAVFILGDLVVSKDRHPAQLVNAITDGIAGVAHQAPVYVLYGNHDGPSPDRPFWRFLGEIPGVTYLTAAEVHEVDSNGVNYKVLFSPWGTENAMLDCVRGGEPRVDFVFMHATVEGARAENGSVLAGSCPARFLPEGSYTRVYSGDIHTPQVVGDVEYVGAPYHVHYGDNYDGRVLEILPATSTYRARHYTAAPRLHHLKVNTASLALPEFVRAGDRVKLAAHSEHPMLPADWQEYVRHMRGLVESVGADWSGAVYERTAKADRAVAAPSTRRSDESIVRTFAQRAEYTPETVAIGVELVKP